METVMTRAIRPNVFLMMKFVPPEVAFYHKYKDLSLFRMFSMFILNIRYKG